MAIGPLSKTIAQISKLEVCRNASSYWSFVITLVLLLDLLITPSLAEGSSLVGILVFLVLRVLLLFALAVDRVAENVSYAIRVNWELVKLLEDKASLNKLYTLTTVGLFLVAATLLVLSYISLATGMWNLTTLSLVIVLIISNSLLYSLIIRPKSMALGALFASLASIIDVIAMYFIAKRPSELIVSGALSISDVFVILGINVVGVTLCQSAES
ncbi:hypothetical protein [Ignicoccus hospitalis]|nr:hypothetical protein [Ignicoccus hospitalis]HIH90629.1 hypothetical protein [Desulfurococcaceae archaeon]